ncbi:MAG: hypothetical protein NW214_04190 [Pseudanabaenaceae cyanobacterium bins.39]|nr:hypothetical protein [Pseudanabaenaceae cyanobacterium bins.39]
MVHEHMGMDGLNSIPQIAAEGVFQACGEGVDFIAKINSDMQGVEGSITAY